MKIARRNLLLLFKLKRVSATKIGVFGVLCYYTPDGYIPFLKTFEDPWMDNKQFISCIPTGAYLCKRFNSPKFGNVFQVDNVANREKILIHKGNNQNHTEGCILLGSEFTQTGVSDSKNAFELFMSMVKSYDTFHLDIQD